MSEFRGARRLTAEAYVEGVVTGERRVLAQAITLVESTRAADRDLAVEVLDRCMPQAGKARRVGISGVPGAGKSTFVEALGTHLTRERGETVAVLSIDPSSPVSGGSILGDKTRMETLAADPRAFVRPSPSGGWLGGVARRTREAMVLCEAAGFANVLIETVGTGQSEVAARAMVDTLVLLMLAGAGDELQGIKRGITELADVIAVNKADGENEARAAAARAEMELAVHFLNRDPAGWKPRVMECSARTRRGVSEVWGAVLDHQRALEESGGWGRQRSEQALAWMQETIRQSLEEGFRTNPRVREQLPRTETAVLEGRRSPFRAAAQLLSLYFGKD